MTSSILGSFERENLSLTFYAPQRSGKKSVAPGMS
jgi:hypothetical protein